ncbi:hypothetical protein KIN20_019841 [Parelaphostrongylus tenuis]|uniref:Uncharacterized protein n=1 Tax=Parelaphostrongylus tenuis TaxID=148309 RepID=A0AAD5N5C3_PARTN|nr:hypothetical protein KIN20_019841 [Parelaphostrongylus tenuis]
MECSVSLERGIGPSTTCTSCRRAPVTTASHALKSMFMVRAGLDAAVGHPQHALVIAGQHKLIKAFPFRGSELEAKFRGEIDTSRWEAAMKALPLSGSLPLLFNQSRIISVPDTASRHNTPSHCHIISRELRTLPYHKGGLIVLYIGGICYYECFQELNVVLICDIDNVLANIAAIARSFPVYSRKTDGHTPVTVKVEVCVPDGELVDDDINYLKHLACSIRDVCCMVDTPANELTTEAFLEKATYTAKQLGVKQVTISGEDLRQQGFGGIYCVGKAGPTPPIFTVLSFEPQKRQRRTA